ncbi:MAG: tRNA(5-methylaminomethyl-2-thiouridylate) methyltransferase [Desulfovibrio sp.]|nr:tRNA(5-methylaminomethyl-2-thiouridylate) methyltransferase [Desulfovibrio sp.]
MEQPDIIVLFSGGLDSILTALLLREQGLGVRCLHCHTPFFGDFRALPRWRCTYGLDIESLDLGEDFVRMLKERPAHGFGKHMNPCVDCKILLLRKARLYMESVGAKGLATGEVLGQRPMSQRRDVLNVILREAGVRDLLLRPLSAKCLEPTPLEESGLVDRERLLGISGRGRHEQMALARHFGLTAIPTPAGGCLLTERENTRRFWPVLTRRAHPTVDDFRLADLGRQFWRRVDDRYYWLVVGRNRADNQRIEAARRDGDLLLAFPGVPGPLLLARDGADWPDSLLIEAGCLGISYAGKAASSSGPVTMRCNGGKTTFFLPVRPERNGLWAVPAWDEVHEELRGEARQRMQAHEERKARVRSMDNGAD